MDTAVQQTWTQEKFFAWAEAQEGRYEFDGTTPLPMTGGEIGHDEITGNIIFALRERLRGGPFKTLGPNAGITTAGSTVRYPDALVTSSEYRRRDRLVPAPVIVFEVISPTSAIVDRITKVREYQVVASILRYVIVETEAIGLTVFSRADGTQPWTAMTQGASDILSMPEIGIEVPVGALYEGLAYE